MEKDIFKEIVLVDNEIDKAHEKLIFSELFAIDDLQEYLKAVMAADIKRHFVAPKEQQDYIKGCYDRTMQMLIKIQKSSSVDKK